MPHTLSIFPALLDFQLLGPFLIRLAAGLIFVDLGSLMLKQEQERWATLFNDFLFGGATLVRVVAWVDIIGGFLLIFGLYAQPAALVLALLSFLSVYLEWRDPAFVRRNFTFHLMLFVMTLSLLFTGAGFLAFDLPL